MNKEEGMRILEDLKALRSELDLTVIHVIELEKLVMIYSGVERFE